MKKSMGLIFLAIVFLPVLSSGCAPASTPVPSTSTPLPTNTPLPTDTRIPTNTPIPPTVTPTLTPTLTLVPGPTGTPIFPPIESFVGIWRSLGSTPESFSKIVIASDGSTLFANIRYACEQPVYWTFPKDCEAGVSSATYSGNPVLMSFDYESLTYLTLSLNGDVLHVTTFMDFPDNSSRTDLTFEDVFVKDALPSFPESEQIIFYHFDMPPYHGRVGAIRTPIFLFLAESEAPYTSDTAADLRTALELVLQDERNGWISSDLDIVEVTFRDGHADIVLQGEYSGESDEVLIAARMQILLTVFVNPSVQTAAVTLNGDTIGNLGVSSSTDARPADYVYTRAEMEEYLVEHHYSFEWGDFLDMEKRPTQPTPDQ